jgi:hypothetical protein
MQADTQLGRASILIALNFLENVPVSGTPALSGLKHEINIVQTCENKTNLSLTG